MRTPSALISKAHRCPPLTHAASIKLGGVTLTKANVQPGWKWSECIKPHVGTDSCQAGHIGVLLQGQIHVVSDDGSEITINAGEAYRLAPGHNACVVGDERAVKLEFFCRTSTGDYSKMFLLFELCCGTPPSCLKVMGWVGGGGWPGAI